jgi:hypothetical protein
VIPCRLGIVLIAKGSMNNLHRLDVVETFRAKGVDPVFIVREDYKHLIRPIPGCRYAACRFVPPAAGQRFLRNLFCYIRSLYPSGDVYGRSWFGAANALRAKLRQRLSHRFFNWLAGFRGAMRLLLAIEGSLYRSNLVEGLESAEIDQLLLLGIGTHGAEHEIALTWWARHNGISVVHMIANYDHLTIKGFRGVPVDRLLVWGPVMRDDAIRLHAVDADRIRIIGSVRYDNVGRQKFADRETFLRARGLDPAKRTILFAGAMHEFHYYEMLEVFEEMRRQDDAIQLILRIYPDKLFMVLPYIKPLIRYGQSVPGVYVSVGDPNFRVGRKDEPVPEIEEDELMHALKHADVVVNLFSTIALEACIFDKPVVYVLYYPQRADAWIRPPRYFDWGLALHNRRMVDYGIARMAADRKALIEAIGDALANPGKSREERKRTVELELGPMDWKACERLAESCVEALASSRGRMPDRAPEEGTGMAAGGVAHSKGL